MKIAVLLSGQPRFISKYTPSILANLVKPNNADVFCHVWNTPTDRPFRTGKGWENERIEADAIKKIQDWYDPQDIMVEEPLEFGYPNLDWFKTLSVGYGGGAEKEDTAAYYNCSHYSLWYGLMQANLLKQKHEHKNKFRYDVVVRCRFDLGIHHTINVSKYDVSNHIWTMNNGRNELLNDWFFFGNSENMNIIASIYNLFDKYHKDTGMFVNELFFKKCCDQFGIQTPKENFVFSIESRVL